MIYYLATPYTHSDPAVRQLRYEQASSILAHYLLQGSWAYAPIVHCHELCLRHDLPHTFDFWHPYNCAMIKVSDALHVQCLPGWRTSRGIAAEIAYAQTINLPILYCEPPDENTTSHFNPSIFGAPTEEFRSRKTPRVLGGNR